MKSKKEFFLALTSFGLYCITQTAQAAPGQPYSDEWLEGRISGAIAYNSAIDSSKVDVDADGGLVTLSGKVPSEVERDFIERIARTVDGVSGVKNEISVDEDMKYEHASSFQQKISDATVTAAVKSKLLASRNTHGLDINVDTDGNIVTLSGIVQSEREKSTAEQMAFETSGVREVRNQLRVEGATSPTSGSKSASVGAAVSDAWISTKTRAMLNFTNDFPGSNVEVNTTNGKVTLKGFARTPEQKQRIEQTVADVNGVKSVENLLVIRKTMEHGA